MKSIVSLLLAFSLALTSFSAFALDITQVRVGGIYYHDAWNNNTKVKVLGKSGGDIEIVYLEGSSAGEVDFVRASDLLAKSQSEKEASEDAGQAIGVTVGIGLVALCYFSGKCGDKEKSSSD